MRAPLFLRMLAAAIAVWICATPTLAQAPYILVNLDTAEVIAQRDSGEYWYPASLTKLMTVYLVFRALEERRIVMASPVRISSRAATQPPARMGFSPGTVVTIDNALKMLIVKSANDVAVAVAETLAGTEAAFVAAMNREAERLGLTGTRFVNPHGLPASGQRTTARDMAALAAAVWSEFPQYRWYFSIPAIRYGSTVMPAGNSLLEYYRGANGMKTGYICSSGYNLVATATRGATTLLVVVLGESAIETRATAAASLLDAGFRLPIGAVSVPLGTYRPASSAAAPRDLRPTICPGGDTVVDEAAAEAALAAVFGPKVAVAEPVRVVTGGADFNARVVVDMPAPRPRPALPGDAGGGQIAVAVTGGTVAAPQPPFAGVPLPRPRP